MCSLLGPIFLIFMQFSARILSNNRLGPTSLGLALRLANHGSATVTRLKLIKPDNGNRSNIVLTVTLFFLEEII